MSEADYQYECNRAELLGLSTPDRNEFFARQRENISDSTEQVFVPELKEEILTREDFQRIRGELHHLNTVLMSTQKKLTRVRTIYENFSNHLTHQMNKIQMKRQNKAKGCENTNSGSGREQNSEGKATEAESSTA